VSSESLCERVPKRVRRDFGKWRHLKWGVPAGEDRI
jgi:hypothetical protein